MLPTQEGDAMTHDEYDAAEDADGERRMQRALDDEHERRVAGKAAGAAPAGDGGAATGTAEGRGDDGAQAACSE
jgi:hypothetical protein